ncbi:universal stress protein [Massilia sp. ST3]|uniref:universal stress protein n=1 Tax=Massilia sp. ST3 TaxID=2824903 RepID=UPI001B831617|nr:universal stress protein [Massilia sp. ST3]MBQ5946099.1 universal stress protein [Massilia sp. ST3]
MYKTIIVHVDGSPRQDSRLRAAVLLANRHGAHLVGSAATGVSMANYAILNGSMAMPIAENDYQDLRDAVAAQLHPFEEQAAQLGAASVETRVLEDNTRYALLLQSRYADLVVLSQDDPPESHTAAVRHLPEFLALHGPRPVLVVPTSYRNEAIPGTAVVGWDGSVQAIRAIQAALPLLREAPLVRLVLVNPDELAELHGEEPGADMALYLARHGVQVEVVVERTRDTAGDALVALAHDTRAGLMVAGIYGHSRYREWALGGATRALLHRAPAPLLCAH